MKPTLIKLASGFEAVTGARFKPEFLPTLPTTSSGRSRRSRRQLRATSHAPAPATVPMLGHL